MPLQFPQNPDKLTPAEERLLEFIESHREEFLFMTIGQLSAGLGVSEATISRFARHLGCQDFKQLKNTVLAQNHLEGPAGKLARTVLADGEFDPRRYLQQQQLCLQKTMENLDDQMFEEALHALLGARRVFIQAKSASAAMGAAAVFPARRLGFAGGTAARQRYRTAGRAGTGGRRGPGDLLRFFQGIGGRADDPAPCKPPGTAPSALPGGCVCPPRTGQT